MKRGDDVPIYRIVGRDKNGWYYTFNGHARIMAICDGYLMLRFPRAMPFIESVKTIEKWLINPPRTEHCHEV
jgi:hypothetical protein